MALKGERKWSSIAHRKEGKNTLNNLEIELVGVRTNLEKRTGAFSSLRARIKGRRVLRGKRYG